MQQSNLNSLDILEKNRRKISETGDMLSRLRFKVKNTLDKTPEQLKVTQFDGKKNVPAKANPEKASYVDYRYKISQIENQLQMLNFELTSKLDRTSERPILQSATPPMQPSRSNSHMLQYPNPYKSYTNSFYPKRTSFLGRREFEYSPRRESPRRESPRRSSPCSRGFNAYGSLSPAWRSMPWFHPPFFR